MDVSRETPDVTTKPKCYDLTNLLVPTRKYPKGAWWHGISVETKALLTRKTHALSSETLTCVAPTYTGLKISRYPPTPLWTVSWGSIPPGDSLTAASRFPDDPINVKSSPSMVQLVMASLCCMDLSNMRYGMTCSATVWYAVVGPTRCCATVWYAMVGPARLWYRQAIGSWHNLCRGKRLHTRNLHLRNHRGFPAAFPNGCSVAFSNVISLFSCMFQRIVTCTVDLYWNCPMDVQWHFPMDVYVWNVWCVICCPEYDSMIRGLRRAYPHTPRRGAIRTRTRTSRQAAGGTQASKREVEYRIPRLHSPGNSRRFPEMFRDLCKNKRSFL